MKERGQIITLHCCNQKLLEEHVQLLEKNLRNKITLNQLTNGKIGPLTNNMTEQDLEDINHGIWLLVEDYTMINPEISIDFESDLTILLDGLVCGDPTNRLTLLVVANQKKWEVVSLDKSKDVVQQHIMDHVNSLLD
ncbi:MAG: hypothetical protein WCO66_03360 [Candidatus Absconditabacteria bacterium]